MLTRSTFVAMCVVGIALMAMVGTVQAAAVITNSSFENDNDLSGYGYANSFTGWTAGGDDFSGIGKLAGVASSANTTQQEVASSGITPDGTHVAFMQVFQSIFTTSLSTTVTGLTPGQQYQLTFYDNARHYDAVIDGSVTIGGDTILSGHTVGPVEGNLSYTKPYNLVTSSVFTATAASEVLTFINHKPTTDTVTDATWLIDKVQINAVPEPSAVALLCAGAFGLLAYAWRRRRA